MPKRSRDQAGSDNEEPSAIRAKMSTLDDSVTALAPPKLQDDVRTLMRIIPAHTVQEIIDGLGVCGKNAEKTAMALSRKEWMWRRSIDTQIAAFMANEFVTAEEKTAVRELHKYAKGNANIQQCWMARVWAQDDMEEAERHLDSLVEQNICT